MCYYTNPALSRGASMIQVYLFYTVYYEYPYFRSVGSVPTYGAVSG